MCPCTSSTDSKAEPIVTSRLAFLGLGSNLGDRMALLSDAVAGLAIAGEVVAVSQVYETDPVGPYQPDYLNAVAVVRTDLSPQELLGVAQGLERAAGRVRGERWGPRTLDVDVLLLVRDEADRSGRHGQQTGFGECETVETADLVVPHPRMWERHFVLAPLHDVAPELVQVPEQGWQGVRPTSHQLHPSGR